MTAGPHSTGEGGPEGYTAARPLCIPVRASGKLRLMDEMTCTVHPRTSLQILGFCGLRRGFPTLGGPGAQPRYLAPEWGKGDCLPWGLRELPGISQIPPPPIGFVQPPEVLMPGTPNCK